MSNNMKRIKKTSRLVDNKIMIVKKNYISNIYIYIYNRYSKYIIRYR